MTPNLLNFAPFMSEPTTDKPGAFLAGSRRKTRPEVGFHLPDACQRQPDPSTGIQKKFGDV